MVMVGSGCQLMIGWGETRRLDGTANNVAARLEGPGIRKRWMAGCISMITAENYLPRGTKGSVPRRNVDIVSVYDTVYIWASRKRR